MSVVAGKSIDDKEGKEDLLAPTSFRLFRNCHMIPREGATIVVKSSMTVFRGVSRDWKIHG